MLKNHTKPSLQPFLWLFLTIFVSFSNPSLAQEFNFDDDYQGEESSAQAENLIYDPFEKVNRKIFAFNEVLDQKVVVPVVKQYRILIPKLIRNSVGNFVSNIAAPFSIANSALQGDSKNAMASFSSFLINTTVGVVGLFDVAGTKKITYAKKDFGQTLGKYGVGSGPFLIIPVLGPNNLRDFSGFVVERAVSPLAIDFFQINGKKELISDYSLYSLTTLSLLDTREGLIEIVEDVRVNSFDVYATMRSAYMQRRHSLILNK